MRTLAFDGRMGASGDMLLGALVAAGADPAVLEPVEDALGVEYHVDTTKRRGIRATAVDVRRAGGDSNETDPDDTRDDHHHNGGDHQHDADHHRDSDGGQHAECGGPRRTFSEVIDVVESLDVPATVEENAVAIFELLGTAEASVHGTDLTETHFHEVGADDAIADVVGVSLLLSELDPGRVVATPLAAGGGTVEMSHGSYPVPPPAVVELAERADWSMRGGPVDSELLTPTGAAILTHVADGVDTIPGMNVSASGYGAGRKSFPEHPNVLGVLLGDSQGLASEAITVLETNLDDATPETLGGLHESLADAGALDVSVIPMTMKKSRPGHLVKVVTRPENAEQVARRLAVETGTLGVREHGRGHRFVVDRERESVTVEVGDRSVEIGVKVATVDGELVDASGEYDDAMAVAADCDLPVRELRRRAESRAYELFD